MTAPTSPWPFDRRPDFELTMPSKVRGHTQVLGPSRSGKTIQPAMPPQAPAQADHSHPGPGPDSVPTGFKPD
jgi:hypothetical protein